MKQTLKKKKNYKMLCIENFDTETIVLRKTYFIMGLCGYKIQ